MRKISIHVQQEREKNIIASGKEVLLQSTRERIMREMTPNYIEKQSDENTKFKAVVGEYLQVLRGTDPFGLGVIRGFPRVFRGGISGVAAYFSTQDGKQYVFKTQYKHLFNGNTSVLQPEAAELEAMILRAWGEKGTTVPGIAAEGHIQMEGVPISYYIMEYVQSVIYENQEEGKKPIEFDMTKHLPSLYHALTKELACMHTVPFSGYGPICKNEHGKWGGRSTNIGLGYAAIKGREAFFNEMKIRWNLDADGYSNLMNNISAHIEADLPAGGVLLHNDIGLYNIIPMSVSKVCVIDPLGKVGHPYEDLAGLLRRVFIQDRQRDISEKISIAKDILTTYAQESGHDIKHSILIACMLADCTKRLAGMLIDRRMNYRIVERDMVVVLITYLLEIIQNIPMDNRCIDFDTIGAHLGEVLSKRALDSSPHISPLPSTPES